MFKTIIIMMQGGLIQDILGDPNIKVKIIDYDIDGISNSEIVKMPEGWGIRDEVYITHRTPNETNTPEDYQLLWNLPESDKAKRNRQEAMLQEITRLWLDLNGFECSLDEIADHELDEEQLPYYNFLTEEFKKL